MKTIFAQHLKEGLGKLIVEQNQSGLLTYVEHDTISPLRTKFTRAIFYAHKRYLWTLI